jgi:hypothetical protein
MGLVVVTGLNEQSLVGLEHIAFVDNAVEFARLHAFAEDIIEAEIEEGSETQEQDQHYRENDGTFFHIVDLLFSSMQI